MDQEKSGNRFLFVVIIGKTLTRNCTLYSILQVLGILKDPCFDKLSVVAMETIMISHICFPLEPDEYEQVRKMHVTVESF